MNGILNQQFVVTNLISVSSDVRESIMQILNLEFLLVSLWSCINADTTTYILDLILSSIFILIEGGQSEDFKKNIFEIINEIRKLLTSDL